MEPIDRGGRGLSVGRCGQTHGALVSALQKYIRRCEVDKAVRVAVELDRFAEIKSGGAIRSNMINRVAVIAMEDVGPAHPALLAWVAERRAAWQRCRDDPAASAALLVELVAALARSPKSRVASHARAAYAFGSPEAGDAAALAGVRRPAPDPLAVRSAADLKETALVGEALANLRRVLAARSPEAVYWACRIENATLATPVDKSRKAAHAIWREITAAAPADVKPAVAALHGWFKELAGCREEHCFATCAILIICFLDASPAAFRQPFRPGPALSPEEVRTLVAECPRLELDEYCLDKHTAEGRRAGKDVAHFATEGALVVNQAAYAFRQPWYDAYMELRVGVAESALFREPLRCQLVTSAHKTCTYLATLTAEGSARLGGAGALGGAPDAFSPGSAVFVKGPWTREAARAQVAIDRLKARLSGVRALGCRVVRARPDLFPDTPLGMRRVAMCPPRRGRVAPAYFLVAPDLNRLDNRLDNRPDNRVAPPRPVKIHGSKCWPPTPLYDGAADRASAVAHADLAAPTAPQVVALALRFALGVGDTCGRNFLVEKKDGYVHNLDEEKILGKYAPVRFGAAKKAAVLTQIEPFWPDVLAIVRRWPNDLRAGPAQPMLVKVRDFVAERVAALEAGGPSLLYE